MAGYGQFYIGGKYVYAHRLIAQTMFADWDPALCVLHSCDRPCCVNPAHLRMGTQKDNASDRQARGRFIPHNARKTECRNGHPFNEENTVRDNRGQRVCVICRRAYQSKWRKARRTPRATKPEVV